MTTQAEQATGLERRKNGRRRADKRTDSALAQAIAERDSALAEIKRLMTPPITIFTGEP